MTLLITALLACGFNPGANPASDAERLADALNPELPLKELLKSCAQISDVNSRGDCQSASVQTHVGGEVSDCQSIEEERWRSECIFRLAERTRKDDLEGAIALCAESDYDRECWGHLVRDEAAERVALSPHEQAEFAQWLTQALPRTDASDLYWEEWAIARFRADIGVQREDCGELSTPSPCVQGLRRARKRLEAELGEENRCAAYRDKRPELALSDGSAVLNSGVPGGPETVALCGALPE